jgi:hypothetical protein
MILHNCHTLKMWGWIVIAEQGVGEFVAVVVVVVDAAFDCVGVVVAAVSVAIPILVVAPRGRTVGPAPLAETL